MTKKQKGRIFQNQMMAIFAAPFMAALVTFIFAMIMVAIKLDGYTYYNADKILVEVATAPVSEWLSHTGAVVILALKVWVVTTILAVVGVAIINKYLNIKYSRKKRRRK